MILKVASYDFELPMIINRPDSMDLQEFDYFEKMNSKSERLSEFLSSTKNTTVNQSRKTSRYTLIEGMPRRKINAIGLRHALKLSAAKIFFQIPITYLERLRDGGFYEAKVRRVCINCQHKNSLTKDKIHIVYNNDKSQP